MGLYDTLSSWTVHQELRDSRSNIKTSPNKNEFVSLIYGSSQPPLISHGIGKNVSSLPLYGCTEHLKVAV